MSLFEAVLKNSLFSGVLGPYAIVPQENLFLFSLIERHACAVK